MLLQQVSNVYPYLSIGCKQEEYHDMKALLLGENAVTMAIEKVLSFFEIVACNDNLCDVLVMADRDQYSTEKSNGIKFFGNERLIYLESTDKNTVKHNLYFLTYLLPTYRIPLEQFSIVELVRVIADIKKGGSE